MFGPNHALAYINDALQRKIIKDNARKFTPNTKVKFTGTAAQLAEFIDPECPPFSIAETVISNGAIGIILDSCEIRDFGVCYSVKFGKGYSYNFIPENYLDFA